MSVEVKVVDVATLSAKIGQMIRSNELKMAGKLLATARTHLHQLAEKDAKFQVHYEHIADLRNQLMEPGNEQFDEKRLLVQLLDEEKELHKHLGHHAPETLLLADTLLKSAAAIVLVYAQDAAADTPLEL
jgi:hypothetical protein